MARRVSQKAWDTYTKRLEAQRMEAYDVAYAWVMKHGLGGGMSTKALVRMMVEDAIYNGRATAALAAAYFDQVAIAEEADVVKAVAVNDPTDVRVRRMSIAANRAKPKWIAGDREGYARAIASAVAADVKRQATNTIMLNAQKNGAEYAWIPGGNETCAFCIAIASAGWQPARKATAMGMHADHIHDNCKCEFAIRFDESTKYDGYDPQKYADIYDEADGRSSQAKINSIRREQYAENKDKINEQHRERYAAMDGYRKDEDE